ncbi:MAG: type II secretion system F family protein [Spirochaetales bacterium]|nr:type II secretion system F family protein [Spirochaetales bacterium]
MARFRVRLVDADGRRRRDTVEASDAESAIRVVEGKGLIAIGVEPDERSPHRISRVGGKPLADFTSLSASLLSAGLTLRDALSVVAETAERQDVRKLASDLGTRIDAGSSLHDAFDELGYAVPPVYRGLVRIGERVGALDAVFPRLAAQLESTRAAREKLVAALIYPSIVLLLAIFGLFGLSIWILPRLAAVFGEIGGEGPSLSDRVGAARAVTTGLVLLLSALSVALAAALVWRGRHEGFARTFDAALLRIPLLGKSLAERASLSFAFAMESLVAGGLPIDEALLESASAVGNRAVAADILAIRESVLKGKPLSQSVEAARRLPRYLGQWFAVGERTGKVEAVFGQLRAYYQRSTERALERAMALVEPGIILLVGMLLLGIVVFFIVPLFSAYGSLL